MLIRFAMFRHLLWSLLVTFSMLSCAGSASASPPSGAKEGCAIWKKPSIAKVDVIKAEAKGMAPAIVDKAGKKAEPTQAAREKQSFLPSYITVKGQPKTDT